MWKRYNYTLACYLWLSLTCFVNYSVLAQSTLRLDQPTYLCQSGFISINTTGGDGTTLAYSATGVALSSPTSNTGVVHVAWRIDQAAGPVVLQATQSGVTASYALDVVNYCSANKRFLWPILKSPVPDLTLLVNGESSLINVGSYFKSNNIGYDYRALFRYTAYGLPPGMGFNSRAGLPPGVAGGDTAFAFLSGKPTTPGTYQVVIIATNQGAFTEAYSIADTFNITALAKTNLPPYVVGGGITPQLQTGVKGIPLTIPTAYAFVDPEGGPLTYISSPLPPGLSLNSATGVLSGEPQLAGQFAITVGAVDDGGLIGYVGFYLAVKNASRITSPQSATVGIPYSTTTANAFFGTDLFFSSSSLPPGLTIHPTTGVISGTPTANGHFGVTVTARNSQSGTQENNGYFLDVQLNPAIDLPPFVVGSGLTSPQTATVGVALSIATAYAFSDPEGKQLTYFSSPLPAGLHLNPATGVISGTPVSAGLSGITIGVSDDGNRAIYSGFYLRINTYPPSNLPPVVVGGLTTPLNRLIGSSVSIPTAYAFTDPEGGSLTFSSSSLPPGLFLNETTGIISGTPTVGGLFGVTIGATDEAGAITYSGFFLTINLPPYVVGNGLTSPLGATVGVGLSIPTAYAFADPEGRPLTYSSSPLAAGISLNATTGVLSGTPVSPIRAGITIVATDDGGASVSSGFYLLTEGQTVGNAREAVTIESDVQIVVLENPVETDEAELQIQGADGQTVWLTSFDAMGRQISSSSVESGSEHTRTKLKIGQYAGMYLIRVVTVKQQRVLKVFKR